MIKLIHRYNKSIGMVFLFIAFCFAISSVTVDVISGQKQRGNYAVKVNDREFSMREFDQASRRIEDQYKQMFGENYSKIAQSIRFNIPQQALDNLIDGYLLEEQAASVGFAATQSESNEYIVKELFSPENGGPGFTPDAYRGMLQRAGMNAAQFEETVRKDLIRSSLTGLLEDVGVVTSRDVQALMRKQETEYSFSAATISYDKVKSEVPAPSEDELKRYYDKNATDFDLPARVSYEYAVLDPTTFKKDVTVLPQDIELFYTDNSAKFAIPEQVQLKSIKILYPKESDPKKMAAVKEKAQKVFDEANAQKPFETLVTLYSEDLPSKAAGGLRGWVSKATAPKGYAEAGVFDLEVGAIAKLVEADYGFEILKVVEKKAAGQRALEEVKSEIEESIRSQEAPAYAAAKAKEIADKSKKGGEFATLVTAAGLKLESTTGLLGDSADPTPQLSGLTRNILVLPSSERAAPTVVDVGQQTVLVKVKEYLEPAPAPFEEVKAKIADTLTFQAAKDLAQKKAKELLEVVKTTPAGDLKTLASSKGATIVGPYTFTRGNPSVPSFSDFSTQMRDALFSAGTNGVISQQFPTSTGVTLLSLEGTKVPSVETTSENFKKYQSQAEQTSGRRIAEEMIALLKAKAEVDFDPALLGSRPQAF